MFAYDSNHSPFFCCNKQNFQIHSILQMCWDLVHPYATSARNFPSLFLCLSAAFWQESVRPWDLMRICSLISHWEIDFSLRVCMWMFYRNICIYYGIYDTVHIEYPSLMSGFLKILDPFEHPVQKQQCWNKREKRGNIKYQSKFVSPSNFDDFYTSECFMFRLQLLSKEQAE